MTNTIRGDFSTTAAVDVGESITSLVSGGMDPQTPL